MQKPRCGGSQFDEYGFLKFIMAMGIAVCHYNLLISNPVNLVGGGQFVSRVASILLEIGKGYGGRLPICFFVLSGYVMMKGYYNVIKQKEISFKAFFARRVARNFPLLWFSVTMMAAGQWTWFYFFSEYWTGRDASLWSVLVSLTGLSVGTVFNTLDTLNGPIWYISVLLVCYAFYWVLTGKVKENNKWGHPLFLYSIPIAVGLSVLSYSIHLPFLNGHMAIGYIGFFWGAEIYLILNVKTKWRKGFIVCETTGFLLIILILSFFRERANWVLGDTSLWMAFLLIPFPIIFLDQVQFAYLFKNRINDTLGRLSYPLFLLHIPSFVWVSLYMRISNKDVTGIETFYGITLVCMSLSLIWLFTEKKIRVHMDKFFLSRGDVDDSSN